MLSGAVHMMKIPFSTTVEVQKLFSFSFGIKTKKPFSSSWNRIGLKWLIPDKEYSFCFCEAFLLIMCLLVTQGAKL